MRAAAPRRSVVRRVTKPVDWLCVKVLYGRETTENSIMSGSTGQAVWLVSQSVWYLAMQIVYGNPNVSVN